jgi:hypothetical protein
MSACTWNCCQVAAPVRASINSGTTCTRPGPSGVLAQLTVAVSR